MIDLTNLKLKRGTSTILENVNLKLRDGVTFVIGKNGSGKSSFLKLLAGELSQLSGAIEVEGNYAKGKTYKQIAKRNVSVCPEINELPVLLTSGQLLTIAAKLRRTPSNESHLTTMAERMAFDIDNRSPIFTYSTGMRQKLCILACTVGLRSTLIFDESFGALDPESRTSIIQFLPELIESTSINSIFLVSHANDHELLPLASQLHCKDANVTYRE